MSVSAHFSLEPCASIFVSKKKSYTSVLSSDVFLLSRNVHLGIHVTTTILVLVSLIIILASFSAIQNNGEACEF